MGILLMRRCVLIALLLVCPVLGQRRPLTADEAIKLLEIGVPESDITAVGVRLGGFSPVSLDALDELSLAGASPSFLAQFPKGDDPMAVLKGLAERCDSLSTSSGQTLLAPRKWRAHHVEVGEGAVAWRISPPSSLTARAGVDPALFLFIQDRSSIPIEGAQSVTERLESLLIGRLTASECPSRAGPTGTIRVMGRDVALRRVETSTSHGDGVVAVAFAVLPDGRALGMGYSAPLAQRAACEQHLADLAQSFPVPKVR